MTLVSPYKGYQRGQLVGKLLYTVELDLDGFAELNLDRKQYFGKVKGKL